VAERARHQEEQARLGRLAPIYRFDYNVLGGEAVDLSATELRVPGYAHPLRLDAATPYDDMRGEPASRNGDPSEPH
jgi:acetoacetyl-[acyl-carrier protein] synthase